MLEIFVIAFGIPLVVIGALVWRAEKLDPASIVASLLAGPEPRAIRVSSWDVVWDPSKPEPSLELEGPGRAIYTLDKNGNVLLSWRPRNGPEVLRLGPIPAEVQSRVVNSRVHRNIPILSVVAVVALYLALTLSGFICGRRLGGVANRPVVSLLGAFAGFLVASIIAILALPLVGLGKGSRRALNRE